MDKAILNYLTDILDAISNIEESLQGLGYEDYRINRKLKIDVVRNFERIIATADNIPQEFKDLHPDLPWEQIYELRNRFIDSELGINDELIWKVSKIELKNLGKLINSVFIKQ